MARQRAPVWMPTFFGYCLCVYSVHGGIIYTLISARNEKSKFILGYFIFSSSFPVHRNGAGVSVVCVGNLKWKLEHVQFSKRKHTSFYEFYEARPRPRNNVQRTTQKKKTIKTTAATASNLIYVYPNDGFPLHFVPFRLAFFLLLDSFLLVFFTLCRSYFSGGAVTKKKEEKQQRFPAVISRVHPL